MLIKQSVQHTQKNKQQINFCYLKYLKFKCLTYLQNCVRNHLEVNVLIIICARTPHTKCSKEKLHMWR